MFSSALFVAILSCPTGLSVFLKGDTIGHNRTGEATMETGSGGRISEDEIRRQRRTLATRILDHPELKLEPLMADLDRLAGEHA
jgi:hypothetical protein